MLWKLRKEESILEWGMQNKLPEDIPSKVNLEGQRGVGLTLIQMRNLTKYLEGIGLEMIYLYLDVHLSIR